MIQGRKLDQIGVVLNSSRKKQQITSMKSALHSRKASQPLIQPIYSDIEVPLLQASISLKKLSSQIDSKKLSKVQSRQGSPLGFMSPKKRVPKPQILSKVRETCSPTMMKKSPKKQIINVQQQIIIQQQINAVPMQNEKLRELQQSVKKSKTMRKKKKVMKSNNPFKNSPTRHFNLKMDQDLEHHMQMLLGTSEQRFKKSKEHEKVQKQEERQRVTSMQEFKKYMDYEIRRQNNERFVRRNEQENNQLPWGINQEKLRNYWGKMIEIHQKMKNDSQQTQPSSQNLTVQVKERLRRQNSGLGFLNQLSESLISHIVDRSKQNQASNTLQVSSVKQAPNISPRKEQEIKLFMHLKQNSWRNKTLEQKYLQRMQHEKLQQNLQNLKHDINLKKQKQLSNGHARHQSNYQSHKKSQIFSNSELMQRKLSAQDIQVAPKLMMDQKLQVDKDYEKLSQEYGRLFNWRLMEQQSGKTTPQQFPDVQPDIDSQEFIDWLQSLPESFLEQQLVEMQAINQQMNAKGFNYILSEPEQYQFLESFLKEKFKQHKEVQLEQRQQPRHQQKPSNQKEIFDRYSNLNDRWQQNQKQNSPQNLTPQYSDIQESLDPHDQLTLENVAATMIQKIWRGYHTRQMVFQYLQYILDQEDEEQQPEEEEEELELEYDQDYQDPDQEQESTDMKYYSQHDNKPQSQGASAIEYEDSRPEEQSSQSSRQPSMNQQDPVPFKVQEMVLKVPPIHGLKYVLGEPKLQKQMSSQTNQIGDSASLVTIQELHTEIVCSPTLEVEVAQMTAPMTKQMAQWDNLMEQLESFKQNEAPISKAVQYLNSLQKEEDVQEPQLVEVNDQAIDVETQTNNEVGRVESEESVSHAPNVSKVVDISSMKDEHEFSTSYGHIFNTHEQVLTFKYQEQMRIMEKMLETKKVSKESFQRNRQRLDKKMRRQKDEINAQRSDLQKIQQLFRETIKQTQRDQRFVERMKQYDNSFKSNNNNEDDNMSLRQILSFRSDTEQSELDVKQYSLFSRSKELIALKVDNSISSLDQKSSSFDGYKPPPVQQGSPKQHIFIPPFKKMDQLIPQDLQYNDKENILTIQDNEEEDPKKFQPPSDNIFIQTDETNIRNIVAKIYNVDEHIEYITEDLLVQIIEDFASELNQFPISSLGVLMEWDEESELPTQLESKLSQGFPTTLNFIKEYLIQFSDFIQKTHLEHFLSQINTPLGISAIDLLKTISLSEISASQMDESQSGPLYPLIKHIHMMEPVIEEEIWEQFTQDYASQGKLKYALVDDAELFYLRDSEQFHLRMVYEAFNEALNFIRPYGIRGSPYPWKSNPLKVYAHSTDAQNIEKAMGFAISKMLKWGAFLCGFIPEKIETPQGEVILIEEDYLNQIKEDRLQQMLENEIQENEEKWLAYEEELTEVGVELADIVFEMMLDEASDEIQLILQKK